MKVIKTNIIPSQQHVAKVKVAKAINFEAICVFSAIGFFLDQDCFFKNEVCLRPATLNTIDDDGFLIESKPWFTWHYSPRDINKDTALNEFADLFETIVEEQTKGKKVILPISGGLDSRTQAVALKQLNKEVSSYSYEFENGYNETAIAEQIAKACNFEFEKFEIKKGYLWNTIKDLAKLNGCYSEFTHPRQMAIYNKLNDKGDVFSLGHWGDVLFDSTTEKELTEQEALDLVLNKIVKRGGIDIATALWSHWSLEGEFIDYLRNRIKALLDEINIENSSAKIRAFKSMFWAPRWTSINLSIFNAVKPISLPYYDDRMCEFICSVPESILASRQLQIEYIKSKSDALSKITWQEHKPFNLNNYQYNRVPYNIPNRIINKLKRTINASIGKKYVQRNWELQFLGNENDNQLKHYLFNNGLDNLISQQIIEDIYTKFKKVDQLQNAHPISMLLTLSLWQSTFNEKSVN